MSKKIFHETIIEGRLIDAATLQPLQGEVEIRMRDAHSAKNSQESAEIFGKCNLDAGGNFHVKAKSSKAGPSYFIFITPYSPWHYNGPIDVSTGELLGHSFHAPDDATTNLETVYVQMH